MGVETAVGNSTEIRHAMVEVCTTIDGRNESNTAEHIKAYIFRNKSCRFPNRSMRMNKRQSKNSPCEDDKDGF